MDTSTLSATIYEQAKARKTIDKHLLQSYAVQSANEQQERLSADWPHNAALVKQAQIHAENWLFTLDCYAGYNSRAWSTFIRLPHWHAIVDTLHAYDDAHKTHHYHHLLTLLDGKRYAAPKWYYGSDQRFNPTTQELKHALHIHNGYCRAFGIA